VFEATAPVCIIAAVLVVAYNLHFEANLWCVWINEIWSGQRGLHCCTLTRWLVTPLDWMAARKFSLELQVPHIVWHGPGLPMQVVEYHAGVVLVNVQNGHYLRASGVNMLGESVQCHGGNFQFEVCETDVPNQAVLLGVNGMIKQHCHMHRDENDTTFLSLDGKNYKVVPALTSGGFASLLDRWLVRLFKLGPMDQRHYFASNINEFMSYLLIQSHVNALPSALVDLICVLPMAIRNLRACRIGLSRRQTSHEALMLTMEVEKIVRVRMAHESHRASLSMSKTFTHKDASSVNYIVRAEEVMDMLSMLRCLEDDTLHSLLVACIKAMRAEDEIGRPSILSEVEDNTSDNDAVDPVAGYSPDDLVRLIL